MNRQDYIYELILKHYLSTGFCSVMRHMIEASETYEEIMKIGKEAIPVILKFLKKEKHAGMSIILLLMGIIKESVYEPEEDANMFAYDVKKCKKAWLDWGKENNFI
jgi:hypothetical protein